MNLASSKSAVAVAKILKPKKRLRGFKEAYFDYSKDSKCSFTGKGYSNPEFLHIKFKGLLAHIPALKNQKVHNTNILRPDTKAHFALMTDLFHQACKFKVPQYDPKIPVFCLVLCAYRKNAFDEDNVATSVRDWLEPKFIRKKNRGWGAGIVPNDRMVKVYATKKLKSDPDSDVTEIILKPFESVRQAELDFLRKIINTD